MDFFTNITALAALAVVAAQQILKLNIVPLAFANRYPVPTNILLSIAGAVVVVYAELSEAHSVRDWILLVATISVVSAVVYNSTLRQWAQLRAIEGPHNTTDEV